MQYVPAMLVESVKSRIMPMSREYNTLHSDEKCIHFVREREGKRRIVKSSRRWENNIKIVLREIGCDSADMSVVGQD